MADIYSGAWIVIAASQAQDSHAGLLCPRETSRRLSLTTPDQGNVPICFRKHIDHDSTWTDIPEQLNGSWLSTCAWCFQERILARRILFFGSRELYFQCRKEDRCECTGTDGRQAEAIEYPNSRALSFRAHSEELRRDSQFGYLWTSILEEYTRLDLTYESDRLAALSGIAKLAEVFNPGRYVAGLWEKDLLYQLLWEVVPIAGLGVHMPPDGKPFRQANIYVPSFSWTFWTDRVRYYLREIPYYSTACEILEIQSTVPGANIYGQVSNAHIKLKGSLNSVQLTLDRICLLKELQLDVTAECPEWAKIGLLPRMSSDFYRSDWDQLLFLKFFTRRGPESGSKKDLNTNGMIVWRTDIPNTYRRVGTATNIPQSWLESNVPPTEIMIV